MQFEINQQSFHIGEIFFVCGMMNLNVYPVIKRIRVQPESNALEDSMPEVGNRYLWLVIELSPRYLLRNANKKQRQRQRRRIEGWLTDLVVIKVKYKGKNV